MNFYEAKKACLDEGSVLAMPRTEQDISDIKKLVYREYCPHRHFFIVIQRVSYVVILSGI